MPITAENFKFFTKEIVADQKDENVTKLFSIQKQTGLPFAIRMMFVFISKTKNVFQI